MSWNSAKKRFQRDLDKLPQQLRAQWNAQLNKQYALPTLESYEVPDKSKKKVTAFDVGVTAGDLAYIVRGPQKGKITTVFQYMAQNDSVLMADVTEKKLLPPTRHVANQASHYTDYPKFVPRSDIRLVGKEKDESGKVGYLVAEELVLRGKYYDDRYKKWLPRRFVKHHEEVEIPWPSPPLELEDGELSTNEGAAFEKTYEMQSMARSPLPDGVINELRNKYSKHKQRKFSALHISRLQTPDMPLSKEQKLYLAKQQQKAEAAAKQAPPAELSEEIQDFIGERVAKHIDSIESPYMLAHLEALSQQKVPKTNH
ncbi:large ribosomal subunit protein uL24m [Diutina catenulata]